MKNSKVSKKINVEEVVIVTGFAYNEVVQLNYDVTTTRGADDVS